MFHRMQESRQLIIDGAILIAYGMKGGIQYKDALNMTYYERQSVTQFLQSLKSDSNKLL